MVPPLNLPIEPMLAKAVDAIPEPDAIPGGFVYEPKWDGFRGIVAVDGSGPESGGVHSAGVHSAGVQSGGVQSGVEIGSRGSKSLTRYFPELVATFAAQFSRPCIIDGEIIVRTGARGAERLDWDALSQRIHPAASRIARLSAETPASFVAFDLLAVDDEDLTDRPFSERRARLEALFAGVVPPLHLSQTSRDAALARRWLADFEGAGL
ncbi:MAG TPA: hypothetical protein VN759_13135, partial [Pseudolysinimonas sp.]|nr:hypothetical protein [Pseudolysinimonas sp.]